MFALKPSPLAQAAILGDSLAVTPFDVEALSAAPTSGRI